METESAERKAVMAWELVMVFEGGSDDGGEEVGRGRAPALQAKRKRVRKCIFVDVHFLKFVVGGRFCVCFESCTSTLYCRCWRWVICSRARKAAAGYQSVGTKEKLLVYVVHRIKTS